MKRNYTAIESVIFILLVLGLIYGSMMPYWTTYKQESLSNFSTKRALIHVREISKKPHFVGSENHEKVAEYILHQLQYLGLETHVQEGFALNDEGCLVKSKNILTRIEGTNNSKALLLLSHYDSAPHSFSHGASDDASGVATILEGIRAFLHSKKTPQNDIIILFSDAEELGLNGAALFVTKHNWAKEIGLVINFEARGTSGPSYMLMETIAGNKNMVEEFAAANPAFPVSNSLMYSVYKLMPNFTDLNVFKEPGKIQGFNFAFIDDHFNYHTQQDAAAHLDENSLTHQGTYLMPLLNYFSNANLNNLQSTQDNVYFNIPFSFVNYPFDWVLPMAIIALGLFLFLVFIGIGKRIISFKEIINGFIPLFGTIIATGLITFFSWQLLLLIYPDYQDFLNGFTYNGHDYIGFFVFLSLSICLFFYNWLSEKKLTMNHYVAPLFLWIVINLFIAIYLKGAGFFIIPVFFGLFSLAVFVLTQKSVKAFNFIFCIPALILIAPFIQMFPIGLGLKVLFGSAVLTALTFALLLPVFGAFPQKGLWSLICFLIAIGFFGKASYNSGFEKGKAKPNSLIYIYDVDNHKTTWTTYDNNLDSWTKKYLGENPTKANGSNQLPLSSKYNSKFTYESYAPIKNILPPNIEYLKDSVIGNKRYLKIKISPNRKVNRYDIFANEKLELYNFKANGVSDISQKGSKYNRKGKNVLQYYVVDNAPLTMEFNIKSNAVFNMELIESSFDLMNNPLFDIAKRDAWMMPKPFVLNDAVVVIQKIKPSQKAIKKSSLEVKSLSDSTTVKIDSLQYDKN